MSLTYQEVEELLFRASRLGLTTITDGQTQIWHELLSSEYPTLDRRLAEDALKVLATRTEIIPPRGIRPYDLMTRARQISADRQSFVPVELPAGLTLDEERAWKQAWAIAAGRGANREQARAYCEQETGITPGNEITSTDYTEAKERLATLIANIGRKKKN